MKLASTQISTNKCCHEHEDEKDNPKLVPSAYQMVFYSMSAGIWGGNVLSEGNQLPAYSYFDYCRVFQQEEQDAYYSHNGKKQLMKVKDRIGKCW